MKARYFLLALGLTIAGTGYADTGPNGEFADESFSWALAGMAYGAAVVVVLIGAFKAREAALRSRLDDDFLADRDDWGGQ